MKRKDVARGFTVTGFFSAHIYSWDSSFVFHGESHEMWEIVFVQSGTVEVTEDEKIYRLKGNQMIIHAPWEFHRIRSAEGTSPRLLVMSFYAEGELPRTLSEGVFLPEADQILQYDTVFERIHSFLKSKAPSAYAGQDAADRLSAFLIELSGESVTEFADTSPSAVEYRRLVLAMSSHVCENKQLGDFAQECGDSISYIKQLFGKYAGVSPKAYYNRLRIHHAMKLLREGIPIREIAEIMSFPSSNYFSVFFKKHTGLTPVVYRNMKE